MSWDVEFDRPVPLPGGKTARTLREAGHYVLALPRATRTDPKWQIAMKVLMEAAERRGPLMHAHIGMTQALRKDASPAALSDRKDQPWGCRPLKRDR